ncbi:DNA repair protein rhp26, partial [Cryomyces antarcticus]
MTDLLEPRDVPAVETEGRVISPKADAEINDQPRDAVEVSNTDEGTAEAEMEEVQEFDDGADEEARLAQLATGIRDQDDLERDIGRQADQLLLEQANERDNKRLDKTKLDRGRLAAQ